MPISLGMLLALSLVVSLPVLSFLIWVIANRRITTDITDAKSIFEPGEEGHVDTEGTEAGGVQQRLFDQVQAGIDAGSPGSMFWLLGAPINLNPARLDRRVAHAQDHFPHHIRGLMQWH